VSTSHYPQSRHFLDCCDEIGLLVLEEIPGWQHIGDEAWKQVAIDNVGRMIRRDWNHPSIIVWGVRINESKDDHDFYTRTNALAHTLDTTSAGVLSTTTRIPTSVPAIASAITASRTSFESPRRLPDFIGRNAIRKKKWCSSRLFIGLAATNRLASRKRSFAPIAIV